MNVQDCLKACEASVRQHDPDRFLTALFAPAEARKWLYVLYAFNHEIAHISESVREPMLAEIRRQWWRESIDEAAAGRPRRHDVVEALAQLFAQAKATPRRFHLLIDARAQDDADVHFHSLQSLFDHADATAGEVMRIAARLLGAGDGLDGKSRAAGIAYGMTGLLRALPFHAARGKLYVPYDLLIEAGIEPGEVLAGRGGEGFRKIFRRLADCAFDQLDAARAFRPPAGSLPAVLPAALCELYLRRMRGARFDPFRHPADVPVWRQQIALLFAMFRGYA